MKSNHTSENAVMPVMPFNSKELTMSSREIAELTEKNHSHVIRDIKNMIDDLLRDDPNLGHEIKQQVKFDIDNRGYIANVSMTKKYIECLLTGYSVVLRMKVINRVHQLESAIFVPKTLPEALRAYADECERTQQLEHKIKQDAPKVAFIENYVMSGNSKSIRETAKILKMPEGALSDVLQRDKILYKLSVGGNLLPYARPSIKEYFIVKTGVADNGYAYTQTRVTPKGIAWIAQRYASELMIN